MIRSKVLIFLTVLALSIFMITGSGMCQMEEVSGDRVTVVDAPTTHHINVYMGIDLGIFEKHGVKVDYVKVKSLAAARDAVSAGKGDVFLACPTFTMVSISKGAQIKVMAQGKVPCTSILVVRKGSPITRIKDLAGKKVAGISPTCEAVIAFTKAVRDVGESFDLIKLGPAQAMASLEAGVVDAAILEEPFASVMELKGYDLKFRGIVNVPCRFISGNVDFLKSKPDLAKRFIAAIKEADELYNKDPQSDTIVNIGHKYTGSPIDAIRHGNPRIHLTTQLDLTRNDALQGFLVSLGAIPRALRDNELYAEQFKGITW